ncbi:hypothetical protein HPP92_004372 [Vanilla planifolia]|uniref:Uncharacterized protein n=1 Tax=Vanilla planifolia TaxID=51239 RepID=A0A835RMP5_VANPL|nr:hypothetical protein HPP92_004372 [Vanilla planifolia]
MAVSILVIVVREAKSDMGCSLFVSHDPISGLGLSMEPTRVLVLGVVIKIPRRSTFGHS